MPVTASATQARKVIMQIADAEFAAEGWITASDWLHPSLGHSGTRMGCYTEVQAPNREHGLILDTEVHFQFFGYYDKEIDPEQAVDPAIVENYAERFMRALQVGNAPNLSHAWFLNLMDITYPGDPTGNKTRFIARIAVRSGDPSLVETTG